MLRIKYSLFLLGILSSFAISHPAAAAEKTAGILLSPSLKAVLSSGLPVSLLIKNTDKNANNNDSNKENAAPRSIGTLTLVTKSDDLFIDHVDLDENLNYDLSDDLKKSLTAIKDLPVTNSIMTLPGGSQLTFNPVTMQAVLEVNQNSFEVQKKDPYLPAVNTGLSGVANYSINAYDGNDSDLEANITLDTVTSYNENHLYLDGEFDSNDNDLDLDRALFERDFKGRNLEVGYVDGWGMQSFAQVSTLEDQVFYGASYGNYSNALADSSAVSLIPINIYLPSAGEARVFRSGRLVDIQRFSMGSHQLDTTRLPGGTYNVTVKIIVGNDEVSSRQYRVSKPKSTENHNGDGGLNWQVWGGVATYDDDYSDYYTDHHELDKNDQKHHDSHYSKERENDDVDAMAGVSLAGNIGDLQWLTSLYQKGPTSVNETSLSYSPFEQLSLAVSTAIATDHTSSFAPSISYAFPVVTLWGNYENTREGKELDIDENKFWTVGADANLEELVDHAGSLSYSYEKDLPYRNSEKTTRYTQVDYTNNMYTNSWGSIQLHAGLNIRDDGEDTSRDKYVSLNFSLPLGNNVSVGVSADENGSSLDLGYDKELDGFVNGVGASTSIALNSNQDNQSTYNGYANYEGKYAQGTVSVQGTGSDSVSASLTNQGSVGWGNKFAASGTQGTSGVVITLPEDVTNKDLNAVINDMPYPLHSGNNLISLPAYKKYNVQVVNSENAENSYQVNTGKKNFTLYPGNVVDMSANVKKTVTVFGRLVDEHGQVIARTKLHNHIGSTVTDDEGYFAIDINKHYPEFTVQQENKQDTRLDMSKTMSASKDGAMWIGDVSCFGNQCKIIG